MARWEKHTPVLCVREGVNEKGVNDASSCLTANGTASLIAAATQRGGGVDHGTLDGTKPALMYRWNGGLYGPERLTQCTAPDVEDKVDDKRLIRLGAWIFITGRVDERASCRRQPRQWLSSWS